MSTAGMGQALPTSVMEKNRMQLFPAVQQFLNEKVQVGQ
jgi:hypothetical protein